jgi:hypothetical protein
VEKFVGYTRSILQVLQKKNCWLYKKKIINSKEEITLYARNKTFVLTKAIQ